MYCASLDCFQLSPCANHGLVLPSSHAGAPIAQPSVASLLQGVKLRKTTTVVRTQATSSAEQERELNARLRAVDLEAWYSSVKDLTYPTVFVSFSPQDARSMMDQYWQRKRHGTSTVDENLVRLQQRIAEAIASLPGTGESKLDGVFAKLSSRSPKDSKFRLPVAFDVVRKRLTPIRNQRCLSDNDVIAAIMAASVHCLKLESAEDVINTLVTSERVCEDDLPLALNYPDKWSQHIVLRSWIDIPIQYEFRGFVYQNKLTALCQYFDGACFPELVDNKQLVLDLVLALFEQMKDRISVSPPEYVVDIAVDVTKRRAYIIELNPFGKPNGLGTGSVMFDNHNQHDLDILFGSSPFEFRMEVSPAPCGQLAKLLKEPWKSFLIQENLLPQI